MTDQPTKVVHMGGSGVWVPIRRAPPVHPRPIPWAGGAVTVHYMHTWPGTSAYRYDLFESFEDALFGDYWMLRVPNETHIFSSAEVKL